MCSDNLPISRYAWTSIFIHCHKPQNHCWCYSPSISTTSHGTTLCVVLLIVGGVDKPGRRRQARPPSSTNASDHQRTLCIDRSINHPCTTAAQATRAGSAFSHVLTAISSQTFITNCRHLPVVLLVLMTMSSNSTNDRWGCWFHLPGKTKTPPRQT